jgi:[acyl-carrier-protein] S-malonyltransferase
VSKVAFLFPGQGAQSIGMGQADYNASPAAQALFAEASAILGYDLAKLCFEGPSTQLDATEFSQPALFVCGLAALEVLKEKQPELVAQVSATAGLSLGEYTSLVFADVLSFADGLRVVQERGRAMQAAADAVSSGMASILGLDADKVVALCQAASAGEILQPANYLCPGNIAISGEKAALERAIALAPEHGAMKAIPLAVAGAFHTSIMNPAVERLRIALANVQLNKPRIPVISNVDALPHDNPEEIRQLLVQQVCSPVRWEDSIRYLISNDVTTYWEVGPGRVLRGLMKRIDRKLVCEGTA